MIILVKKNKIRHLLVYREMRTVVRGARGLRRAKNRKIINPRPRLEESRTDLAYAQYAFRRVRYGIKSGLRVIQPTRKEIRGAYIQKVVIGGFFASVGSIVGFATYCSVIVPVDSTFTSFSTFDFFARPFLQGISNVRTEAQLAQYIQLTSTLQELYPGVSIRDLLETKEVFKNCLGKNVVTWVPERFSCNDLNFKYILNNFYIQKHGGKEFLVPNGLELDFNIKVLKKLVPKKELVKNLQVFLNLTQNLKCTPEEVNMLLKQYVFSSDFNKYLLDRVQHVANQESLSDFLKKQGAQVGISIFISWLLQWFKWPSWNNNVKKSGEEAAAKSLPFAPSEPVEGGAENGSGSGLSG